MPATTSHASQSLKRCQSNDNILVEETKRVEATPCSSSAAKPIKLVLSQICIQKHSSIPLWHSKYLSNLVSEYTLNTNLSLQPGGMDISLDRTIVLPHCIFILLACLNLRGVVWAVVGIEECRYSSTSWCPFNIVLASTEIIIYCCLDWRALAGQYAWRVLTNRVFALLNDKDFLSTKHVHSKHFGESLLQQLSDCCQRCCQRASVRVAVVAVAAVRVGVRGLLSEWLLSQWLL